MNQEEMETDENSYNALYPQPHPQLCSQLKSFLEQTPKAIKIGTTQDFNNKVLFPLLIRKSIKTFTTLKCNGCTGTHQYVIAGGYASYLTNKTNSFKDIDMFIHCNALMDQCTIHKQLFALKTFRNVSTFFWNNSKFLTSKPNVQFIQVKFDIGVDPIHTSRPLFQDMMALYVLSRFDLPICRVAVKLPLNLGLKFGEVIDITAFDIYKTPTSEKRKLKYEERRKATTVTPPSL